jgi:hypothetical protein
MGMPGLIYRWFFFNRSVTSLTRNVLELVCIRLVRKTIIGMVDTTDHRDVASGLGPFCRYWPRWIDPWRGPICVACPLPARQASIAKRFPAISDRRLRCRSPCIKMREACQPPFAAVDRCD